MNPGASVKHLILILELFFPPELAIQQAFYVLSVLVSLYPLMRLHLNQLNEARRQTPLTGWMRSIRTLITRAFSEELKDIEAWTTGINLAPEYANYIYGDLGRLYDLMGLTHNNADPTSLLFPPPRWILSTSRLNCKFCPIGDRNLLPSLRRRSRRPNQCVWLLDSTFQSVSADLQVARCATCHADYYPDMITRKTGGRERVQVLESDPEFLRVAKHGVWVHKRIALAQEKALQCFHSGWSNFADWVNDTTNDINVTFTYRQSQRLFVEHFSRRLLSAHGKLDTFTSSAHASTKALTENQYALPDAPLGENPEIMGSEAGPAEDVDPIAAQERPLPPNLPLVLARQEPPPPGAPRGYTRMAVMDGKGSKHRKCALDECKDPLYNYKNGRFCETHLDLRKKCGIRPCDREICSPDALTCDDPAHISWHKQYEDRFHRLSFPGVQQVIRRQMGVEGEEQSHAVRGPSLHVQLQALGETPGDQVVHTFKARSIHCLQTVQWACGFPIAWGKCYRSESTPQVLAFINVRMPSSHVHLTNHPEARPAFITYNKACDLLRHIATQNIHDTWITTTKFIVDAWHYIGHRATDVLCRTRCNPALTNGSQPDLVLTEIDDNGTVHQTWAFNTETAEQLNSWLNGFESQLRQMTDVNYDFFIHAVMMIYGETVERKVISKGRWLTSEFWDRVNGVDGIDIEVEI
ncbi:hypothetical protein C8R45DRAFT_1064001 [Mycena sanguinolenta]|nr:hypothetical protein C8R45DRAFT_1064001 [Mycena sanguinolenta]